MISKEKIKQKGGVFFNLKKGGVLVHSVKQEAKQFCCLFPDG